MPPTGKAAACVAGRGERSRQARRRRRPGRRQVPLSMAAAVEAVARASPAGSAAMRARREQGRRLAGRR
eukprot:7380424-Prymnesium_polylepis.1